MNSLQLTPPAVFLGIQQGCGVFEDIELWDLTIDLPPMGSHPGHTVGSTVSRQTLLKYGYYVPSKIAQKCSNLTHSQSN